MINVFFFRKIINDKRISKSLRKPEADYCATILTRKCFSVSPIFQIEFSFNRLNINRGKSRGLLGLWRRRRVVVAVFASLSITLGGDFGGFEHCPSRVIATQSRSADMKVIVLISRLAFDAPNLCAAHDLAQAVVVNRFAKVLILESHVLFARSWMWIFRFGEKEKEKFSFYIQLWSGFFVGSVFDETLCKSRKREKINNRFDMQ